MTAYDTFDSLCKERNVNASQVAKATGIDRSSFSYWKQGRFSFKIEKLCKIANYFEVPVTVFCKELENGKISS